MENYVAIFLSIGTFAFTYYQWIITMNTRRPRLTITALRSEQISHSQKLDFLRLYLPTKWHIVNLADIPNSIMGIKMYAKCKGKWVEGEFSDPNYHKRTTIEDLVPVFISGHHHHTFTDEYIYSGKTRYFHFGSCPTVRELKNLQVKIELEDQYGNFHEQILTPRDVRVEKMLEFPDKGRLLENEESKMLLDINGKDNENLTQLGVVYNPQTNSKGYPHLAIYKFTASSSVWGDYFYLGKDEKSKWENNKDEKIQIDNWENENIKVYAYQENNVPKSLEIEMNGKANKIDLPSELINSLENA